MSAEQHADDRVMPEHDRDEPRRYDRGERDLRHRLRVVLGQRVDAVHGGGRELAATRVVDARRARRQHVLADEPAQRGQRVLGGAAAEPLGDRGEHRPREHRPAEHDERARGRPVAECGTGDDRRQRRGLHDERHGTEHPGGDRAGEQPTSARREPSSRRWTAPVAPPRRGPRAENRRRAAAVARPPRARRCRAALAAPPRRVPAPTYHPRRSATRAIRSTGLGRGAPTAARVTRSRNSQ